MPAPVAPNPSQNHLLAALPAADFEPLRAHLLRVPLQLGQMLYTSGERIRHVHFPTSAIVSLHYVMATGASAESAGVGNEGMVGVPLFMGGGSTPSAAVVQTAGEAYRLEAGVLKAAFDCGGLLQRLLLRYTQALMTQMAQTAACNRHHSIEQQLCRWLLLTLDRLPGNELVMTQELVAGMLGVRREGITEAAGHLRDAGLIHYRRGHIAVLDRAGLELRVCECYDVVRQEMARLLSDVRYRQDAVADAPSPRRAPLSPQRAAGSRGS